MAKPILVANWKNYPGSLVEARSLFRQLSRDSHLYKKFFFFIAPPAPYFESIASRIKNFVYLATQDITEFDQGTYTGVITPDILKSFNVKLSIIGHSERRALGDTNELVRKKIEIALRAGFIPLVCVGEATHDQDGEHFEFLREQLKQSLAGLKKRSDITKLVVAYEPIWAIGKSAEDAIQPSDLAQAVLFIKKVLTDMFGRSLAEKVPILYGGSVEPLNAKMLIQDTGIRGFLVGHASLDAKDLKIIAQSFFQK